MTKNQIEYAKLLETKRSNLANEDLTRKRDTTAREVGLGNLQEGQRHNKATETQASASLDETVRSNKVRETEAARHNVAGEVEMYRHNVSGERLQSAAQAEQARHNRAGESLTASTIAETQRSNIARETETARSNMALEALKGAANAETARSNLAREVETNRSNLANEKIKGEQATASMLQANAAALNADTNRKRMNFQNWKDLAGGVKDVADTAATAVDIMKGW